MIFVGVRQVATERLNEVLIHLNHISELEPKPGQEAGGSSQIINLVVPPHVNVMKGLFFVQLYGALEKSMSDAVQVLLSKIGELKPKNEHILLGFNVVAMARKWKSIKDSGYDKAFPQMTEFFKAFNSSDYLGIDDTLFAKLLQNVWAKSLDEVAGSLGIPSFMTKDEAVVVDELVEKRNAVAHGRESAAAIGQRYRSDVLRRRLQSVQALIIKIIDRLEIYFKNREFLQPACCALY
jgi:hypothetical protein